MRIRTALISTLLAALSGCAACDSVPDEAVTDCDAQVSPGGAATDILFVVDDSGSMAGEQAELARNLAEFIRALLGAPVALDLRVAVTNTSVADPDGTTGSYTTGPAPAGTPYPAGAFIAIQDPDVVVTPGRFYWDPGTFGTATEGWGGRRILSSAELSRADLERYFAANVRVGDDGSGKEQPLAAMRLALQKAAAGGANGGFLRPGARLAVVLITDEDDCSESVGPYTTSAGCHDAATKASGLDPLADYVSFLGTAIEGERRDPVVAVVAGFDMASLDPSGCTSGGTSSSDEPTRLDDFLELLTSTASAATFKDSICSDFGSSLLTIASLIIPQTMPLEQAPADPRMLAVAVNRNGATVPCRLALAGDPDAATADAVYTPPQTGGKATLEFGGACTLGVGDRVDLRIVCAR